MDFLGFEKLIYHHEKIAKIGAGTPQFPVHATLSLGNYCNHRCLWCTAYEYQQAKAKQIDYDSILSWLTRAAGRGLKAVGYVGNGEPTAFKRFDELTREIGALGLQQGMFTNGYLLDRYEQEVLQHFTYIRISLDAGTTKTHAAMHDVSESHYEKIVENLRRLIAKREKGTPTVGIQFATHHENLGDLAACAKMAAEIGADYLSVKPVFNRGSVGERIEKNRLTHETLAPVVAEIRHDFERPDFRIFFRPFQVLSEEADRNILPYDRCVAGFFNLNVYEDRQLVYCGPHRISVGTIDDDLEEVEKRIMALSDKLDLSRCPAGCRYHAMNHLVDSVIHPERAAPYHPNFL